MDRINYYKVGMTLRNGRGYKPPALSHELLHRIKRNMKGEGTDNALKRKERREQGLQLGGQQVEVDMEEGQHGVQFEGGHNQLNTDYHNTGTDNSGSESESSNGSLFMPKGTTTTEPAAVIQMNLRTRSGEDSKQPAATIPEEDQWKYIPTRIQYPIPYTKLPCPVRTRTQHQKIIDLVSDEDSDDGETKYAPLCKKRKSKALQISEDESD